jgi:hypothetical protein
MARQKQPLLRTPENVFDQLRMPRASAESLSITYAELHSWGWTNETAMRHFVRRAWPELSKSGVTQRVNKVWAKVASLVHPRDTDRVDGSVWSVRFYNSQFNEGTMGAPPRPRDWSSWRRALGDLHTMGHVVAATATEARQIAMVTLGPLAMMNPECLSVDRVGPGGEARARLENAKVATKLRDQVAGMEEAMRMIAWERDQLATLTQFLAEE